MRTDVHACVLQAVLGFDILVDEGDDRSSCSAGDKKATDGLDAFAGAGVGQLDHDRVLSYRGSHYDPCNTCEGSARGLANFLRCSPAFLPHCSLFRCERVKIKA